MISPNQIKMQTFTSAGRGAYRAADVDAFMQQIYISYTELLSENASLKKKFASLSSIIDEYNAGKNAIATALVKAQAVADDTMRTAKADAQSIVSDAKEEANRILNETQQQAETYAREKKETADAYFDRAEHELQRVMSEAKEQSEQYVAQVNAQANAVIADANEKAAAIVGAAYKDAQVAKEKTAEIIERAHVEIATTRNEILSFKESALQMLSALLPQVEGINPEEYSAADLEAATTLPQLEPKTETAPVFTLKGVDDTASASPAEEAPVEEKPQLPEELPAQEPFEEDDPFDLAAQDALMAKMEAVLREDAPVDDTPVQPSLFDTPHMPTYQPYVPETQDPEQTVNDADDQVAGGDADAAPQFEEVEPFDEDLASEDDDSDAADDDFGLMDFEPVGDDDEDEDDSSDDEDDDEPHDPFKFRLTKNFDIFDDDND